MRSRVDSAASGYGATPENAFEFGLQAVLDGLEAQLALAPSADFAVRPGMTAIHVNGHGP